jgi:hypothetical protein
MKNKSNKVYFKIVNNPFSIIKRGTVNNAKTDLN